jgi:hypothetical protein
MVPTTCSVNLAGRRVQQVRQRRGKHDFADVRNPADTGRQRRVRPGLLHDVPVDFTFVELTVSQRRVDRVDARDGCRG